MSSEENGDITILKDLKKRDNGKVPLRIDNNTIILVSPENRNEAYVKRYLEKLHESVL